MLNNTLTPAQEKYFTYSRLRDRLDKLIPCYHYTLNRFDAFDPARAGEQSGDGGFFGSGFYFTAMRGFNSCCWSEDGQQPIKLTCYLDIRNPFRMEKLCDSQYDGCDTSLEYAWMYDRDNFLTYLKDNSEDDDKTRIIIDTEDDFLAYVHDNPYDYEEHTDIVRAYEDGELGWYDKDESGTSMSGLYDEAERDEAIITADMLTFGKLHRGLLERYSALITQYATANGCDGIVSDDGDTPVEVVAFRPNQIKSVDNLYPTRDSKFTDNSDTYDRKGAQSIMMLHINIDPDKYGPQGRACTTGAPAPGTGTDAGRENNRRGPLSVAVRGVLLPILWLIAVSLAAYAANGVFEPMLGGWAVTLAYEPVELLLGLVTLRFIKKPRGEPVRLTCKASARLVSLAVLAVCVPADILVCSILAVPVADAASSGSGIATIVSALAVAPLTEEIMFRGVMFGMSRRVMGFAPAAAVNAALFWLVHGDLPRALNTIPLALICAVIREETGSLRHCMKIHALSNLCVILISAAQAAIAIPVVIALPLYAVSVAALIVIYRRRGTLIKRLAA